VDHETFNHVADIGVRGYGNTPEEAFAGGARAMFSVMVDLETVEPRTGVEVECSAPDLETLFVEWLNELLFLSDSEGMVFSEFEVEIEKEGTVLKGKARGEPLVPEKHHTMTEVKAATYSQLKVEKMEDGRWAAQCIVDV